MTERTRKIIVFAVFGVAVIWGFSTLAPRWKNKDGDSSSRPIRTGENAAINTSAPADGSQTAKPVPIDEIYAAYDTLGWGNDPFYRTPAPAPPPERPGDKARLRLMGILYRSVGAQALINGKIVAPGDVVNGYTVVEIVPGRVTLTNGKKIISLTSSKESS